VTGNDVGGQTLRSSKIVERRQQQKDGKNSQSQFPSHRPDFICFPQCALKPTSPLGSRTRQIRYPIIATESVQIGKPTVALLQIWSHLLSRCTHALSEGKLSIALLKRTCSDRTKGTAKAVPIRVVRALDRWERGSVRRARLQPCRKRLPDEGFSP
jgi:hypothetical protein